MSKNPLDSTRLDELGRDMTGSRPHLLSPERCTAAAKRKTDQCIPTGRPGHLPRTVITEKEKLIDEL